MRISDVTSAPVYQMSSVETVRDNLEALAKLHNTDVEGLLKSAHDASNNPLPYQVRALNLEARLNKLQRSE